QDDPPRGVEYAQDGAEGSERCARWGPDRPQDRLGSQGCRCSAWHGQTDGTQANEFALIYK
ncbi:MAG: hypothetical protein M3161_04575, partial [Actinomycetota bacterium]|nr:hypothetical protein [Actinomycetota bacterium]